MHVRNVNCLLQIFLNLIHLVLVICSSYVMIYFIDILYMYVVYFIFYILYIFHISIFNIQCAI